MNIRSVFAPMRNELIQFYFVKMTCEVIANSF